jgi:hypothetical protein
MHMADRDVFIVGSAMIFRLCQLNAEIGWSLNQIWSRRRRKLIPKWRSVITSSNLIRQMCEHVCLQLAGTGRVTICDAPQTDSSFARIAERPSKRECATWYF